MPATHYKTPVVSQRSFNSAKNEAFIPAAHMLYQQFLSAGAIAPQSQLLQKITTVSQTASFPLLTQILSQAAVTATAVANAMAIAAQ